MTKWSRGGIYGPSSVTAGTMLDAQNTPNSSVATAAEEVARVSRAGYIQATEKAAQLEEAYRQAADEFGH